MRLVVSLLLSTLFACAGAPAGSVMTHLPTSGGNTAVIARELGGPAKTVAGPSRFEDLESISVDVSDVPRLEGLSLQKARALTISGCGELRDLAALRGLSNLETLSLGGAPCLRVASTRGLESLTHLSTLQSFAQIADLTPLREMKALRHLMLFNGPGSVAELDGLTLQSLTVNLALASASEADALEKLPLLAKLETFDLTVQRVPALPPMPALKRLRVALFMPEGTPPPFAIDLAFLSAMPALEGLVLGGAMNADLTAIVKLGKLTTLDIAGICNVDARPLARAPRLVWLSVPQRIGVQLLPQKTGLEIVRSNPFAICSK